MRYRPCFDTASPLACRDVAIASTAPSRRADRATDAHRQPSPRYGEPTDDPLPRRGRDHGQPRRLPQHRRDGHRAARMPRAAGDDRRRGFFARGRRGHLPAAAGRRSEADGDLGAATWPTARRPARSSRPKSRRAPILPPEKTDDLKIPKQIPRKLRIYTNGSPYIEVKHQRIRALSKEILAETSTSRPPIGKRSKRSTTPCSKKIDYVEGPDKGAIEALRDGQADCQGRSAVFIALCRANKIPARMVWVDGHCYPEFYLEHAEGEGHWYPCESAGTRAFGEMPLARHDPAKGRQLPRARAQRAAPLRLGLHDRRPDARRREAEGEVHPRAGAAVEK